MPGKIKKAIDKIIEKKCNGNSILISTTRTKLILKGINPDKYTDNSPDEPEILTKLEKIATDFGISL